VDPHPEHEERKTERVSRPEKPVDPVMSWRYCSSGTIIFQDSAFSGVTLNLFARWGCAQGLVLPPGVNPRSKQSLFVIYASAGSRGPLSVSKQIQLEHNREPGKLRRCFSLDATELQEAWTVQETCEAGIQRLRQSHSADESPTLSSWWVRRGAAGVDRRVVSGGTGCTDPPCAHTMMWSAGSASPGCTTRW